MPSGMPAGKPLSVALAPRAESSMGLSSSRGWRPTRHREAFIFARALLTLTRLPLSKVSIICAPFPAAARDSRNPSGPWAKADSSAAPTWPPCRGSLLGTNRSQPSGAGESSSDASRGRNCAGSPRTAGSSRVRRGDSVRSRPLRAAAPATRSTAPMASRHAWGTSSGGSRASSKKKRAAGSAMGHECRSCRRGEEEVDVAQGSAGCV